MIIAQDLGMVIFLAMAGSIYQNLALQKVTQAMPTLSAADITNLVAGTSSHTYKALSGEERDLVTPQITDAMRDVWLFFLVAGVVSFVLTLGLGPYYAMTIASNDTINGISCYRLQAEPTSSKTQFSMRIRPIIRQPQILRQTILPKARARHTPIKVTPPIQPTDMPDVRQNTTGGAETPVAAEVVVAPWFQGGGDVEGGEEVGVVVCLVVVVPGEAGAVGEDGAARRDLVVIVDDEGEVGHGFVAAVKRDLEVLGFRVLRCVDGVYAEMVLFV
ncbi:unnamed protein product [Aspergillus oryzae]|nr:unnamed protein product [Aspergillus oryzae]